MSIRWLFVIGVNCIIFSLSAYAESRPFFGISDKRSNIIIGDNNKPFYEEKERGWFWYENQETPEPTEEINFQPEPIPEPQQAKTENIKPKSENKPVEPKPLSSEWFRKKMESYRDNAIDNPSEENVQTYLYLQRVMLDKAEKFAEVSQQVVMSDPVLDENTRRPLATFGAFAMDEQAQKGIYNAAKKIAETAGLWFFYSSTCSFCEKEAGVLKGLIHAYGFKILPIAIDGLPLPSGEFPEFTVDHGQSRKLGVEGTPALFLVKPGDNGGVISIGTGLLSGDEIVKRAITLTYNAGWIDQNDYNDTKKVRPIRVDTKTIQEIDYSIMNNPNELVKKIRENLKNKL